MGWPSPLGREHRGSPQACTASSSASGALPSPAGSAAIRSAVGKSIVFLALCTHVSQRAKVALRAGRRTACRKSPARSFDRSRSYACATSKEEARKNYQCCAIVIGRPGGGCPGDEGPGLKTPRVDSRWPRHCDCALQSRVVRLRMAPQPRSRHQQHVKAIGGERQGRGDRIAHGTEDFNTDKLRRCSRVCQGHDPCGPSVRPP